MTPHFDGWGELWRLLGASTTLIGMAKWWRVGSEDEDKILSEAADELISGVSDADLASKIKDSTGINIREQMTLEEAEDWAKDRDLRGMRWRN